jgi:hypothetical protein
MQHVLKTPNCTTAMLSKMMLILFGVLFWVGNVSGQSGCGAPTIDEIKAINPESFKKYDEGLLNAVKNNQRPITGSTNPPPGIPQTVLLGTDQVVPVVFHLIGSSACSLSNQ